MDSTLQLIAHLSETVASGDETLPCLGDAFNFNADLCHKSQSSPFCGSEATENSRM
jgi:hypothetical protein